MQQTTLALAVLLAALCALTTPGVADDLVLAENGVAKAAIVIAPDATPTEQYAASELARFLGEVTSARFHVVTAQANAGQGGTGGFARLLVGPGAAKLAYAAFPEASLGEEGLLLSTVGRDLILAGGRPRGTLYAVYMFLEDYVGCRWWTSQVSTIPQKATLTIPPLSVRIIPRLEYRESFWFDALDGDWAARNRCNGHSDRIDPSHGGKHTYEGFVHTAFSLIPPDKYFKDHPDWFAEIDGQRKWQNAQLCLTNDEMRAELVKNLKERLRKNPEATIASVSQNDCAGNCHCAKCAAIDQEEGSPAGSLLRFVNAVAAEIEPEFPRVAIDTLAYQYTRKPPAQTRPRPNVIVRLCSIECSFSKPLDDERNKAFRDDLLGWSQICKRLYIWDYTTNFAHYILPHPNLRVLGPNIRFFADHGVKGVFEQGAYESTGSEMAELRAWVLAKLLWDPTRDPQKLVDEFLDGYYGPAAPQIRAYLKLTHDAVEASGDPLGCYSPPDAKFLSARTLTEAVKLLEAAEKAAAEAEKSPAWAGLKLRVQTAEMPVWYACLVRWDALRKQAADSRIEWPLPTLPGEVYQWFMDTAQKVKATRISEGTPLEAVAQRVTKSATQPK